MANGTTKSNLGQVAKVQTRHPPGATLRGREWVIGDALYDISLPLQGLMAIVDPLDATRRKHFPPTHKAKTCL